MVAVTLCFCAGGAVVCRGRRPVLDRGRPLQPHVRPPARVTADVTAGVTAEHRWLCPQHVGPGVLHALGRDDERRRHDHHRNDEPGPGPPLHLRAPLETLSRYAPLRSRFFPGARSFRKRLQNFVGSKMPPLSFVNGRLKNFRGCKNAGHADVMESILPDRRYY